MKTNLLRLTYRFIAFLTDKTKGFPLFSKWKIALGSLLIGSTVVSCKQQATTTEKTDSKSNKDTTEAITCYETAAPEKEDTVKNEVSASKPAETFNIIPDMTTCYEIVMCYDPVAPIPVDTVREEEIFPFVEEMPEFKGGEEVMHAFLRENLQNVQIEEAPITGTIVLKFVVEKDGTLSNIQVLNGNEGSPLAKEVIRVVKLMPEWKPGKQNGKPVRVYYHLPVNIHLK